MVFTHAKGYLELCAKAMGASPARDKLPGGAVEKRENMKAEIRRLACWRVLSGATGPSMIKSGRVTGGGLATAFFVVVLV